MVEKCIECKYYKEKEGSGLGTCSLHYRYMMPNETCNDFTNVCETSSNNHSNKEYDDKIHELETRIEKLEKLVWKYL